MGKRPSYEDLQKRIAYLEKELSVLRPEQSKNPFNINQSLFFEISEYSKNAVALFETKDKGKSFIIKYFNKKAEEIEKVKRENVIEKNLVESFPSVLNSGFLEALQRVFRLNAPEEFPSIVFSSDKIIEWRHNYIYKLSDDKLVSLYIDETENKIKESELKKHREKLQMAMEAANYFSFEINLLTEKIETPHEIYKNLGYRPSEINKLMQKRSSFIHPEDYKKAISLILRHSRGLLPSLYIEFRIKNKKGNWIWFMVTGKIIDRDENLKPIRLVGLIKNIQEEKEILLKLKESEKKFKNLIQSSPTGIFQVDLEGNITVVNESLVKILGSPSAETTKNFNVFKLQNIIDAGITKVFKECLDTDKTIKNEKEYLSAWGKKSFLKYSFSPIKDSVNNTIGIIGILDDITKQKQIEKELIRSKEKFKSLATLLPEVIFETDIHGNISFVNLKAFEIFGYIPQDIEKGLNIVQILAPEEIDRARENFKKVLEVGNVAGKEYVAITKSGKRFPILVYSNVIKDGENTKGLRGIVVNISDIKKTQEQLKTSEENFRQLSENINDAFWLRSLDHKVIYSNPACYKIVGENFKNIFEDFDVYKNWIHPDDKKRIIKQRENNLKNQDENHFYEHRIIRSDGEIRWLWIRTFPVFNEKTELYRRAGIASDITEQKKLLVDLFNAKEKAEESDKLKSAFLANMSHEIRTPMNGILGFVELLKDDFITKKGKADYLKIIDLNGKQLLNLINDILDVSKITASQLSINKTLTEINPLLRKTYYLFIEEQKRLQKQDIKFNLKLPEGKNNIIFTDITRLQQIFNNLLNNAFKFTYSGSINFGYKIINNSSSDYYQFFVSDTGLGITENIKEYIFERFGQGQTNKYSNQPGTGLGLAISKGLIELLNGKIWFESTPENIPEGTPGGSTFYFTIPIINNVSSIE